MLLLLRKWWPAVVWMIFIFIMSSLPGTTVKGLGLGAERVHMDGHFMMYLILCLAFYRGVKKIWLAILLCILFSITDEFHQLFVPGRTAQMIDIYTDAAGAGVAGLIIWKLYPYLPNKLKNLLTN